MAAALLQNAADKRFEVYSAGVEAEAINPLAIEVMRETGITLDNTPTPALNDYEEMQFDYVISLCEEARTACLSFPGDRHNLHWHCPDPELEQGTQAEQLAAFRHCRSQLQQMVEHWLADVNQDAS